MLYGDGSKLSRTRASEQQHCMEIAKILAVTRVGATVLCGDGSKISRTRVSEQQCGMEIAQKILAVTRVGATV